jgi:hypothetical protein
MASVALGVMSLPSHFMATPTEAKAYEIMQEGLKQEITLDPEQDEIVLLSHYAHGNSQEWVMKSRIMILASACFFVLFLLLLIMDVKKGKPTTN